MMICLLFESTLLTFTSVFISYETVVVLGTSDTEIGLFMWGTLSSTRFEEQKIHWKKRKLRLLAGYKTTVLGSDDETEESNKLIACEIFFRNASFVVSYICSELLNIK